jgi:hypothetical protein
MAQTPLAKKLGLKQKDTLEVVLRPPPRFMEKLGGRKLKNTPQKADLVCLFAYYSTQLEKEVKAAKRCMLPHSKLWVGWPKRSTAWPTDLTPELVREIVSAKGLVDNKVVSVDEFWSGMRFVLKSET